MANNFADIYAAIKQKYSNNFIITFDANPASYLSKIVGPSQFKNKIIVIRQEDRNGEKNMDLFQPEKLVIKNSNDLNLTGSPLKDNCVIDAIDDMPLDMKLINTNPWVLNEEYHKGISVEKARAIINMKEFQMPLEKNSDYNGGVWFLCNGKDNEKTLFLQYEFNSGYFSRGTINYLGIKPTYVVNTQSLLQRHYEAINSNCSIKTFIENTYNIKQNMSLRCFWSTTAKIPHLIDLSTCDVILTQTYRYHDCSTVTEDYTNQLRMLMYIRNDILEYKVADSVKEAVYLCGTGIDMEELRESINKLMIEISSVSEFDTNTETECDIEAVIQQAKFRRLTDLTDELWLLLKCCSSYKDLKMAFNILFQCAARCNIVNTPTNKNRLAEIIIGVSSRRLAIPCLTGAEPLELLLEIGLEKLYKDYEYIFTKTKICSANVLKKKCTTNADDDDNENALPNVRKSLLNAVQPDNRTTLVRKTLLQDTRKTHKFHQSEDIVGFKNSNFDEHDTGVLLSKLWQIHCTLEHILMTDIHLNLNSSIYSDLCDQLLKKPTRPIDVFDDGFVDVIDVTVSARDLRQHLEGKDPHSRRITMKSSNKFREVETTFYYNMDNIVPPNIMKNDQQNEDKEIVKDNMYYCWLYRKIQTRH